MKNNYKYNLTNRGINWLAKHPYIALITLSSTAVTIGVVNAINSNPIGNNFKNTPHDYKKIGVLNNDFEFNKASYESNDIVYIVIKNNGFYDENKIKEAVSNNKKIGIILEPNKFDLFTETVISQIYYIISKYRIDLPILYDINVLKHDMENNIKIAKKLFTEFDKYALYVGFLGSSSELEEFSKNYGNDIYKYDRMIRDVDSNTNFDANMIMHDDKNIEISDTIIRAIASSNINNIGEYVIKVGDDLNQISLQFKTSDVILKEINNLKDKSELKLGEIIYVPILENDKNYVNSTIKGIDISGYQGEIDGKKLKEEGVNFVIIKICDSYKSNLSDDYQIDSKLKNNIEECLKCNIPFSVYYYTRAKNVNDAYLESDFIKNNLKPLEEALNIRIPLYVDIERDTTFEPQQNITNLFDKLYYCGELSNKNCYVDNDIKKVLESSTIIDTIYNYFNQYKKGVFNKEQIIHIVEILKEFVETNKLYYYNEFGEQEEITEYIGYSNHEDNMIVYNLIDNVKVDKTNNGYEIYVNRFDINHDYRKTEKISISLQDLEILVEASEIIKRRYNDDEFIENLENCFSPECIISTLSNTLGNNYKLGIYSGEDITNKISEWNSDYDFWVTSHETYHKIIEFGNWNVGNIPIKYDWAKVVQYSDKGIVNGTSSETVDIDISFSEYIKNFITSDHILGYDASIGIFNSGEDTLIK